MLRRLSVTPDRQNDIVSQETSIPKVEAGSGDGGSGARGDGFIGQVHTANGRQRISDGSDYMQCW